MMKPYALLTASDARYGDFLIDHWYASLRDNVPLDSLQVVVLDYGLSTAQRFYLHHHGVKVWPCERNGHVVILRFRDMAAFLEKHTFEQVALSDSGDIIFQADFTPAFRIAPDRFRGVTEDLRPAFGVFLTDEFFRKEDRRRIRKALLGQPMVNAGFILGPADRMAALGREVDRVLLTKDKFGPDQLVVNEIFVREGYEPLPRGYNFVIATARARLEIREGRFYADGELVPVVHNTGNIRFLRPVENFGYGPDRNQLKKEIYLALQAVHTTTDSVFGSGSELYRAMTALRAELARGYQSSLDQLEASWQSLRARFSREEEEES